MRWSDHVEMMTAEKMPTIAITQKHQGQKKGVIASDEGGMREENMNRSGGDMRRREAAVDRTMWKEWKYWVIRQYFN